MKGPGKYDQLCTMVREEAGAEGGAIVIIFDGNQGSGFMAIKVADSQFKERRH